MGETYHVYPADDLIEHDRDTDECVCGPEIRPGECDDGSMYWIVIHHSLDGRELSEPQADGRKPTDGK